MFGDFFGEGLWYMLAAHIWQRDQKTNLSDLTRTTPMGFVEDWVLCFHQYLPVHCSWVVACLTVWYSLSFLLYSWYTLPETNSLPLKKRCWVRTMFKGQTVGSGKGIPSPSLTSDWVFSHQLIHIDKPKCRCCFFLFMFSWFFFYGLYHLGEYFWNCFQSSNTQIEVSHQYRGVIGAKVFFFFCDADEDPWNILHFGCLERHGQRHVPIHLHIGKDGACVGHLWITYPVVCMSYDSEIFRTIFTRCVE